MSPEKVTIIDRDGWDPINLHTTPERRRNAEKAIKQNYKEFGITLNFQKSTFIDI
ncbi:hypothetical protein [Methanobrevibacter millerae]|uniref:Uncharacterized protein n=1 Tax=Methanobrevibacter millerae TaxID=230361 RepID=A0A1G5XNI4_9EURY|nr:hypothetical protein [Methanobrevibacter millerae]SDA71892.1 hypothetical protein SAMN02910315_02384 [Methanobrevibacter millerae]